MTTPPIDPAAILEAHRLCGKLGTPTPIREEDHCLPYRLAKLAQEQATALASAWDEGAEAQAKVYGMDKDTGPNPYHALAGEQP
jgi:2-methylcitrate dehydratase PrpD